MRSSVQTPSLFRVALLSRAIGAPLLAAFSIGAASLVQAQQSTQQYDIAAGPLSDALAIFATKAGITLPINPAMVNNLNSTGLQGQWSKPYRKARTPIPCSPSR
jgi:hypothetical protein